MSYNLIYNIFGFVQPIFQKKNFEHFPENNFTYKFKEKGCGDCPYGSYAASCSNCVKKQYNNDFTLLKCDCKKHYFDTNYQTSVMSLDTCDLENVPDIANCNGELICGTCYNTNHYDFQGNLRF